MKNLIAFIVVFIASFFCIQWLSGLLITVQYDAVAQNPNSSLQAAVTFGGVNILALFIYFLIAIILTTVIFVMTKAKIKKRRTN